MSWAAAGGAARSTKRRADSTAAAERVLGIALLQDPVDQGALGRPVVGADPGPVEFQVLDPGAVDSQPQHTAGAPAVREVRAGVAQRPAAPDHQDLPLSERLAVQGVGGADRPPGGPGVPGDRGPGPLQSLLAPRGHHHVGAVGRRRPRDRQPHPRQQEPGSDLGQRLAKTSERPTLPWTFTVVDQPVVNAFAVPGGFIYITRGILGYLENEAQLVGVLGHEIGHVTARHSAQQYSRAVLGQAGLLGLGIFVPAARPFGDIGAQALGLLFLKYGRDDELQSDSLGAKYAATNGWDPRAVPGFLSVLARMREGSEKGIPNWLSTHPEPGSRVQEVQPLAEQLAGGRRDLRVELRLELVAPGGQRIVLRREVINDIREGGKEALGISLTADSSRLCADGARHPHGCREARCPYSGEQTTEITREVIMSANPMDRYDEFFSMTYQSGALDVKTKHLAALAASLGAG